MNGMTAPSPRPLIGIICNFSEDNGHRMHTVGDRYLQAINGICNAVPVAIPALGETPEIPHILSHLDGVVLTGGRSNVEPKFYGGPPSRPGGLQDTARDETAFTLVRNAIKQAVPIFGICRGIQEMNVALGGSLHQYLHEVDGRFDHRMERHVPMGQRLRPRQRIHIQPGGVLANLVEEDTIMVNTLHGQGIDQPADCLRIEALAEDGTIEAVSVRSAASFAVGVQWHAEFEPESHPLYRALFAAFGDAAHARRDRRYGLETLKTAAE